MLTEGKAKRRGPFAGIVVMSAFLITVGPGVVYPQNTLPPSSPPTSGTLVLDGTPLGAILTIDGERIGPAKGLHQALSPGPHVVEISAEGYETQRMTVNVPAGGEKSLQFALARLPGTLVLRASPDSAVIAIDGKKIGPARGFRQELSAGDHELEISAEGYETQRMTVNVPAGGEKTIEIASAKLRAPILPSEQEKIIRSGQEIEQLPKGKIYLHAPMQMKVGDRRSVDARVGVDVPDEILKGQNNRAGDQTAQGTLRVSHEMTATLNGPGFKIEPITPEQQTVAEGFPTVWQWQIEAEKEGAQELEATLYAVLSNKHWIDSYTQKISVSVKGQTWNEWLKSVSEEIDAVKAIAIALGGAATAALGWLGISASRRTRSSTKLRKSRLRVAKST